MSINGSTASFLPFTINGLTDASFSNSNLGVATATSLTLTSATPLKLARFDLDKNLVSASVDESEVAVLTSNVFDGTQTMKPGHTTNINNVIETTIIANPPYDKSSFTTSGISGYTAPLGTLSGPVAGEYSISQTASDRSIMKINSFTPQAGRKYVYTFTMRIIDAPEAYVSVEQGGVQRSNTIIQIGSDDETISDTFTFDPAGSTLVFKIYTGSLDPWTATWSSFSLGYYEASINAPINNLTINNLATEILAFPSTSTNSESWSVYSISTMGNPSTLGGLVFQEATLGVGAYLTGGVIGATSFQFNTLSGNAGKVVCTNADQVMSTTINASQLDFITALTSQAADSITTGSNRITQEYNATVGDISTLVNRATLDAGLALVPNLLPLNNTWSGSYNQFNGTVSTMGSNKFIQPYNATALDISTLVNRATLDASIAGLGAGILNLNNNWTGTNTFYSTLTTTVGQTTSINGALSTSLVDLGFTSASFTTAGITGAYTPPLGTITNPSGSTYQITQTAAGRSIMAISGFTPSVGITYIFEFNIKCTIGTATISVEQDNILVSPALYQLTTGFNKVVGSFTYNGTPNTVVFKIYTGVASWNAQWDSFTLSTYSIGMNANMNALTVNNRFTQRYNALAGDVSTLVNRATLDSAVVAPFSGVSIGSVPYESASNVFSNSLITQGTADLGYTGASFTASTGIASITFSSPTYTANSNASVQGIINATALPTSAVGLPCIATFTALTFPLFTIAPYPYFTLTSGATVVYTSAIGASGTIVMPFTPTSTTLFITIFFKSPPTGVSAPVLTWTNFTITTPSMITTGFNTTTGRQTVGSLVSDGSIVKRTVSDGSLGRIAGGDASFSPYLEFLTGGTSRGYVGDCNASNMYIASENGATLNFLTQGALRMTIDSSGFTTLASKELRASSFASAAGGQIRITNGPTGTGYGLMLYNDGGGFYILLSNNGDANGSFNALRPFFIELGSGRVNMNNNFTARGGSYFLESLPQQTDQYTWPVCINTSNQLVRSQCLTYNAVQNNSTAWSGGYNLGNAFYRYNSFVAVNIIGKLSYYVGGGGLAYPQFRIYSQSTGQTWTYDLRAYFNVAYSHTTFPFSINFGQAQTTATGWFDVYIYNGGGVITDGNDQLWYNVNMYPGNNY